MRRRQLRDAFTNANVAAAAGVFDRFPPPFFCLFLFWSFQLAAFDEALDVKERTTPSLFHTHTHVQERERERKLREAKALLFFLMVVLSTVRHSIGASFIITTSPARPLLLALLFLFSSFFLLASMTSLPPS